jgi:Fe-S cluster assembly protein SufD
MAVRLKHWRRTARSREKQTMTQSTQDQSAKVADKYGPKFERFAKRAAGPAWLAALRRAGITRFGELGLPTLDHEDWRFTNVAPIARLPFRPALKPSGGVVAAQLEGFSFAKLPGVKLVFVNGHFAPGLSSAGNLPAGVKAGSLAAALTSDGAFLERHLGRYAQTADNGFAALNQAFFVDGGFVHVPAGTVVEAPIQFVYVSTATQSGTAFHPRNLVVAEANSKVTVLETYVSLGGESYFTNAVTELFVGDNARLEFVKFQDEAADAFHVAAFHGEFGRASNARVHSFALGARLSRNNIRTKLAGEGLECILNGLYLTRGEQLADHHMVVEHAQPHCASHEYFNGILDDKSKGVFHGRILVQQIAQKTDAKQTNKNLLLSDNATADTKPQLEIYADDVKCTHGATIGQLNDESIFYLRSRGIGPDTARQMLIHAFAGEIIERIQHEPAREALDKLVWDRLEANPHLAEK